MLPETTPATECSTQAVGYKEEDFVVGVVTNDIIVSRENSGNGVNLNWKIFHVLKINNPPIGGFNYNLTNGIELC